MTERAGQGFLARRGATMAALAAGLAALPGVGLPFLSDDWSLIAALRPGFSLRTPFAYVRPLSSAWLWCELKAFGMSPAILHLSTAVVMALAAAVLVILLRRLTGDAHLAALAGVLFALHPHHVENAAWIAARPDVLSALLALLALGAYARWLEAGRAVPLLAMVLLEAALLAKESAATVPVVALVIGLCARAGRPPAGRLARGAGALLAVVLAHFVVLWPWASGRSAFGVVTAAGFRAPGRLADFVSAAIFGSATEIIEARLLWWLLGAMAVVAIISVGAWRRAGRLPGVAWVAGIVFFVAIVPALISFQARYLYLPGAAAATGLAALLLALDRRGRWVALAAGAAIWTAASLDLWASWYAAGRVSRALVAETVAAASAMGDPAGAGGEVAGAGGDVAGPPGIFIVNVPHLVRGAPVFAELGAVTEIVTGRRTPVRYAALVNYARADAEGLERSGESPLSRLDDGLEIALAVPDRFRSGLVWPPHDDLEAFPPGDVGAGAAGAGPQYRFDRHAGELGLLIPSSVAPADRVWYWSEGHLHPAARDAAPAR